MAYQLIHLEACRQGHVSASQQRNSSFFTRYNTATIRALEPFATYKIWISITGVRDGAYPNDLTGTTLSSGMSEHVHLHKGLSVLVFVCMKEKCGDAFLLSVGRTMLSVGPL